MILIGDKQIHTIVSDFDGTLLRGDMLRPSEEFFSLIPSLLERGVRLVAASGRQYANLHAIMEPYAGHFDYIAENGGMVMSQGRLLHKMAIDRDLARALLADMVLEEGAEVLASGEESCYISNSSPEFASLVIDEVKNVTRILEDFAQVPESLIKISLFYTRGSVPERANRYFREKYGERLLVVESGNGWLDFMEKGSGKDAALRVLADRKGFSLEHTAAFGDSENDIGMLGAVGLSFAMSTAHKEVISVAHRTCHSVEEVLAQALAQTPWP